MQFKLVDSIMDVNNSESEDGAYLIHGSWDDWFTYETSYGLWVKKNGQPYFIGTTKIGSSKMKSGQRTADVPSEFTVLAEDFFSLGNDEAFYIELNTPIMSEYREAILNGLRDISFDEELYLKVNKTNVFTVSLSRDISLTSITGRFRRLSQGNIKLSNYDFGYKLGEEQAALEFKVNRDVLPPSNIHTIIGRNGVGKSHVLSNMIKNIVENTDAFFFNTEFEDNYFANILSVNYSTFENKEIVPNNSDKTKGYLYYHLSSTSKSRKNYSFLDEKNEEVKPDGMDALFIDSIEQCFNKKPKRWKDCINILYSDPVFRKIKVTDLYNNFVYNSDKNHFYRTSYNLFSKLSSGHKIVLLTLTKLVELSEEKTLIIMDEPEMHLHPPLLGSFIRSLSKLLNEVNGVAILATHSPIILQETQRNCVYKIVSREGNILKVERPVIETFGEDIGVLTSEVFGLEVTESGFRKLLKDVVDQGLSFEESRRIFGDNLGSEAYTMLLTQINLRDKNVVKEVRVIE